MLFFSPTTTPPIAKAIGVDGISVPWCSFYGGTFMNTLVILLSAVLGQAEEQTAPQWRQSYTQAQNMAAQIKRPVAVFLTPGPNSLDKLIPGGLNDQAREILTSDYIPVVVDTTTPEGQRLARAFELRDGQGLVLSDRAGAYQAFWSQGNLTNEDLVRTLQKYANQTNIRMTEVAGRSSLYPAGEPGSPAATVNQRGNEVSTVPAQRQRRLLGSRSSDQRARLFQGRMSRRSSS
jgi:hypothetical protein